MNLIEVMKENKYDKIKQLVIPKIYDYLDSITIDTFKNKIKNKDTFIVYVGRPTCSDCELLDDRLISNIEEDSSLKKILYMNITIIHENKSKWNDFKSRYHSLRYTHE